MKTVKIKNISIEGFGSFHDEVTVTFTESGVTLIKGINGVGKTTIFSALSWCLFKTPLKDISKEDIATWPHLRKNSYRGTKVAVELEVDGGEYMIVRHQDYKGQTLGYKGDSKLMLFETTEGDYKMIGEAQYKGDQQQFITRLLGVDANAFLNSIVFGQRMKRLIEADNKDKRALFESLFEVDFVKDAKDKADAKIIEKINDIKACSNSVAVEQNAIAATKERVEECKKVLKHFDQDKEERIEALKTEHTDTKSDIKALKKRSAELKVLADKYNKTLIADLNDDFDAKQKVWRNSESALDAANRSFNKFVKEIASSEKEVAKLKVDRENVKTMCPTCEGPLKKTQIEAAKNSLTKQIEAEEKVLAQLQKFKEESGKDAVKATTAEDVAGKAFVVAREALQEAEESMTDYEQAAADLKVVQNSITHKESNLENIDSKIEKEKAKEPPAVDIEKLKAVIGDSEVKIENLNERIKSDSEECDRLNWWTKKGFSAGGLKAFVFNAMLAQLNISVQKYASRLGVSVSFTIDMIKESKPFMTKCYRGDKEINYEALSGGQKQKIDAIIAFAMHDVVNAKANFNILVLDEVFEGLDEQGISSVFEMIRMKAEEGKAVYVITHSKMIDGRNCKTMNINLTAEEHTEIC